MNIIDLNGFCKIEFNDRSLGRKSRYTLEQLLYQIVPAQRFASLLEIWQELREAGVYFAGYNTFCRQFREIMDERKGADPIEPADKRLFFRVYSGSRSGSQETGDMLQEMDGEDRAE